MAVDPYAEQRYRDGLDYAQKATLYDQQGQYTYALTFYSEAVEALVQASQMAPLFAPIMSRVDDYGKRAEELRLYLSSGGRVRSQPKPVSQSTARDKHNIRQLEYLLEVALLDDEKERYGQAEKLYSSAIELALRAQTVMANESDRLKVRKITEQAMNRLEELKQLQAKAPAAFKVVDQLDSLPSPPKLAPTAAPRGTGGGKVHGRPLPLTSFLEADPKKAPSFSAFSSDSSSSSSTNKPSPAPAASPSPQPTRRRLQGNLSDTEVKILKQNSKINRIVFLPWHDQDVSELRIVSPLPMDYKDPDGLPALAEKQKSRLKGWLRPTELCEDPKMVYLISSFTIKQTLIGDCSFVASLAVCADYERKFKTRLITRVIYPQNRHGEPIINPNGQYLICLNLNGCKRKVNIDDRLPVGHSNELLCSYSSNDNEFWISLIEKAYMKVMGGYDFPGSSSNIDLHALTGWIPERMSLKDCSDQVYQKIETTMKKGMALVTVATGPMSESQAERAGLVQTHAYAVLNVVHIKGHKLLQLKNPWSHQRWKGNFSEHDNVNWTPELRRALNFDQTQALQVDNGVFWIDWKSVCTFYDVLYINWKPDMFKYKHTVHDYWKPSNVEKDVYNISNNPQYTLQVNCGSTTATVWILLSRHITTKNDFAHNEKFITLHIATSNGRRLYLPPDRYTVMGVKINTPHYLAKLENLPAGSHTYTVIVSQLDSLSTIYYTIRVYSSCQFAFSPVPSIYQHIQELRGDWKAGKDKPKFRVTLTSASHVLLQLRGPRKYYVWLEMKSESPAVNFKQDSGPSRPGFNIVEASSVTAGSYIVTARTYNDSDVGPFFISASSDHVLSFEHFHN